MYFYIYVEYFIFVKSKCDLLFYNLRCCNCPGGEKNDLSGEFWFITSNAFKLVSDYQKLPEMSRMMLTEMVW